MADVAIHSVDPEESAGKAITTGDLRGLDLFDGTTDEQLAEFVAAGATTHFAPGDVLFVENQPADFWWVLIEGSIELIRHVRDAETRLGAMSQSGQWSGGFRAWDEHGVYLATGRASSRGRILRVPAPDLRQIWSNRFPLGLYLTEGVSRSARNFENMARQKESLAALGTLAAGLAHELNNPAAATVRAVDALGRGCDEMLAAVGRLAAASVSVDQITALDRLRREITPSAMDALAVADREDALATFLSDRGVRQEWDIAAALAAAGVDLPWCERASDVIGDAALQPGLEWVASTTTVAGLVDEVKESTRRISDLVTAVKSYTQLDRAAMQLIDVTEGLDSTLAILAHRLTPAVTVVRDYGSDVPRIEAFAAELNQVWTNLIGNALDAMTEGSLRVMTRLEEKTVVVEIGDSGPGMPAEVRDHAFDPFFTTKPVGEGTGLGLDISRRIVERHNGDISIDLRPGETVLQVCLPLAMPKSG